MRVNNLIVLVLVSGIGGCSLYPTPDDVSAFSTENIVRYGRCEMKSEILHYMEDQKIISSPYTERDVASRLEKANRKNKSKPKSKVKEELDDKEKRLLRLAKVAVAYTFDFNITEHNKAGGDAGFRFPWSANTLDVSATAAVDLTRQGSRVFGAEDRWGDLIADEKLCAGHLWQRRGNPIFPLTGSIGVGPVVRTFIDIEEQGGAKDNFVDTLTFTTQVAGGIDAAIKLEPVPNQFRVVSATAGASASRIDIHKVTMSFAFPRPDAPQAITGTTRVDGDLNAPFTRPADWRARYNLCVADARAKESAFKLLRLEAPEVYCIKYADAFSPQTGLRAAQPQKSIRVELLQRPIIGPSIQGINPLGQNPQFQNPPAEQPAAPVRRTIPRPQVRPNYE